MTKLVLSQRRIKALATSIRDLRRDSVDVVVVNMPVTQDYVDYMPAPAEQTNAKCWQVIRETAEKAGARYVEAGVWDRSLFADPIHLNAAGSERFLDDDGRGRPRLVGEPPPLDVPWEAPALDQSRGCRAAPPTRRPEFCL